MFGENGGGGDIGGEGKARSMAAVDFSFVEEMGLSSTRLKLLWAVRLDLDENRELLNEVEVRGEIG